MTSSAAGRPVPPRAPLKYTAVDDIVEAHTRTKNGFNSRKTRDIAFRKQQLAQLAHMLQDNTARFEEALRADLGRHPNDTHLCELGSCHAHIMHVLKHIDSWTQTKKAPFDIMWYVMSPKVRQEPRGVVLIIAPFNYPIYTSLMPMACAVAAGNTVVLKPSESTMETSALLAELFPKYLDPECYAVVNGAVAETSKLLSLRWDHIFFTGSPTVGKIVATAAAQHLTPVTLELGGKSPVFVDASPSGSNFALAARRILWGKTLNTGQTCMAPDYVLIERSRQDEFVEELRKVYEDFWPAADGGARGSDSLSRIVNERQFDRLKAMLDKTDGKVVLGGECVREELFIAPTVVKDCTGDDSLLADEIFGPILPIVPVDSTEEALAFVNAREHPLALMAFSNDVKYREYNGKSLGYYGFETFSHQRASIDSPGWLDLKPLTGFKYAPLKAADMPFIKFFWGEGPVNLPRAPGTPGADAQKKGWFGVFGL
ncbi:hypothetical protein FRC00_007906 [Tulasnella sp. 408]|nr:hypothetical protein FRC00_007906 [Tulasnella sp. 408]